MAFDKKAWMRTYMRDYRAGRRRRRKKVRPGFFDKKAWSRVYMRPYMQRVRAGQKLERDNRIAATLDEAERAGLDANRTVTNADLWAMLAEAKAKFGM
jgi:hypothetical protein